jgi:hypothetical protein
MWLNTTAAALALSLLISFSAKAQNFACSGNACGVISITNDGGCHNVHNNSNRPIFVQWGAIGMNISPGNFDAPREPFTAGRPCIGTIVGNISANFK